MQLDVITVFYTRKIERVHSLINRDTHVTNNDRLCQIIL